MKQKASDNKASKEPIITPSKDSVAEACRESILRGAGPIELWTALQLKLSNPQMNVSLSKQKVTTAKGSYVVFLQYATLNHFYRNKKHPEHQKFFNDLIKQLEEKGHVKKSFKKPVALAILSQDLKKILEDAAKKLSINFLHDSDLNPVNKEQNEDISEKSEVPEIIEEKVPLSGNPTQKVSTANLSEDIQYVIQLTYHALLNGKIKLLNLEQLLNTYVQGKLFFSESVGEPDTQGVTPITVQFFVSQSLFEAVNLSKQAPTPFQELRFPPKLLRAINSYLNIRQFYFGEQFIKGELRPSSLPIYRGGMEVRKVVNSISTQETYMIDKTGVSAPFILPINHGFRLGSQIATLICRRSQEQTSSVLKPVAENRLLVEQRFEGSFNERNALKSFIKKPHKEKAIMHPAIVKNLNYRLTHYYESREMIIGKIRDINNITEFTSIRLPDTEAKENVKKITQLAHKLDLKYQQKHADGTQSELPVKIHSEQFLQGLNTAQQKEMIDSLQALKKEKLFLEKSFKTPPKKSVLRRYMPQVAIGTIGLGLALAALSTVILLPPLPFILLPIGGAMIALGSLLCVLYCSEKPVSTQETSLPPLPKKAVSQEFSGKTIDRERERQLREKYHIGSENARSQGI